MNSLLNTYSNKKIFITGHTGFKGSWLLAWLINNFNAEIKGYSLEASHKDSLFNILSNANKLQFQSIIADVRNYDKLKKEIIEFDPDFIFHLAAQPLVRYSYNEPLETFNTNIIGTANVLNAVRYLKKSCIIVAITTDKVYNNIEKDYYYKEDDRLGGYDPYSASKAAAEIVIDSYRKSFFKLGNKIKYSLSSARAGNVIGGGDWSEDRLIPDIIKALSNNNTILVRNPNSVRPWQFVLEPIFGYLRLAHQQSLNPELFSDAFNFGPFPNDNLTVINVVKNAITEWGSGDYKIITDIVKPHEANLLQLDIKKAQNYLDWSPKFNSLTAIEKTIKWYKHFFTDKSTILEYTIQQINEYNEI